MAKVNNGEELTWDDSEQRHLGSHGTDLRVRLHLSVPCGFSERYGKTIADLANMRSSLTPTPPPSPASPPDRQTSWSPTAISASKYAPDWKEKFGGTDDMVKQTGIIGVTEGIYNDMIAYSKNFRHSWQDADVPSGSGRFLHRDRRKPTKAKTSSACSVRSATSGAMTPNYDGERAAQELLKSVEG